MRILLFLALLLATSATAQRRVSGTQANPEAYQKMPLQSAFGSKTDVALLQASLSSYMPDIGDAGNIASDAGWAVGYYAYTIAWAARQGISDKQKINEMAFSALYIYNNIKQGDDPKCLNTATIPDALDWLKTNGNCLWRDFDARNPSDCKLAASKLQIQRAQDFRIADAEVLFHSKDDEAVKISAVERNIAEKNPVVVLLSVTNGFYDLENTKYWDPALEGADPDIAGTVALCLVGFDRRGRFVELVAPWGKAWATDGIVRLRYDVFAKYCTEAYRLVLDAPKGNKTEDCAGFSADFSIQLAGWDDTRDMPVFSPLSTHWEEDLYELVGRKKGDQYQLYAENIYGAVYLYAFTLDPKGKSKVIFPLQGQSAAVLSTNSLLVLPNADAAFQLTHKGSDYVCYLVSKVAIPDINERVARLNTTSDLSFKARVEAQFGDVLIPFKEVRYSSQAMRFSTCSGKQGAVALLLRTEVE